ARSTTPSCCAARSARDCASEGVREAGTRCGAKRGSSGPTRSEAAVGLRDDRSDDQLANVEGFGSPFRGDGLVAADSHERMKRLCPEPMPTCLRGKVLHQQSD